MSVSVPTVRRSQWRGAQLLSEENHSLRGQIKGAHPRSAAVLLWPAAVSALTLYLCTIYQSLIHTLPLGLRTPMLSWCDRCQLICARTQTSRCHITSRAITAYNGRNPVKFVQITGACPALQQVRLKIVDLHLGFNECKVIFDPQFSILQQACLSSLIHRRPLKKLTPFSGTPRL